MQIRAALRLSNQRFNPDWESSIGTAGMPPEYVLARDFYCPHISRWSRRKENGQMTTHLSARAEAEAALIRTHGSAL